MLTKRGVNGWGDTHLIALYQSIGAVFHYLMFYLVRSVFRSPFLEAMAFKELLILVAIAIEDVDVDIAMDTTHLTIWT